MDYSESHRNVPDSTSELDIEIHGSNRREAPRTPCLIPAHYNIHQRLYSGFILDINRIGVRIKTDRAFPVGTQIYIQYLDPRSKRSILTSASIAWSSDAAIGVKFIYPPYTPI
jgi:hypothetical protein